ncbi:MAG TPA: hypothetical protein ENN78_01990 [Candidatus Omnitrophica bacterium]|nr:hypothetical protein [Candidatus Omnitrophota bacterium]
MRKLIVFVFIGILLIPVMSVEAASIGGAETQGQGKLSAGIDQEIVFDRDMKLKSMSPDSGTQISNAKFDEMYRTDAKISYGVFDNLDIYIKLGVADFKTEEEWINTTPNNGTIKDKTKNAFMYGAGLKGTILLEDDWLFGADIQYLRHRNKYNGRIDNQTSPADSEDISGKMTVQEWHVAPYIAKKLDNFIPYLGVKYSDVRIKDKYDTSSGSMEEKREADDNVGIFIGTDYTINDNWKFNLEGRFIDETAMSLGVACNF